MRSVFLSAHLDDAILSCGGLIYDLVQSGVDVEVWTYFSGIPNDKPKENYIKRLREDAIAVQLLGAKSVHKNMLDAFGRGYNTVFSEISPDDEYADLVLDDIKREISPSDTLYAPLAVGRHVDHLVLHKACEMLGIPVTYYVDFPYIDYMPNALEGAVRGMKKHAVTITQEGLLHWMSAVREYASQAFYDTPEMTDSNITQYWKQANGIVLWEKPTVEQLFTKMYYNNAWGDENTVSGPGSTLEETCFIRQELPKVIQGYNIKSILDLPCGDFFWMRIVDLGIWYTGADIVPEMILMNQKRYGSIDRKFIYANILGDPIPSADLLFCRDCLPHFSKEDIFKAIINIKSSTCKYLITTTFPEVSNFTDIETGAWRPINLQAEPFNFPEPLELIDEKLAIENYGPKCLAMWEIKDLP